MPQPPREPERPRGADAADAFARALAERSADLGDAIDWDDEDCDQGTWRDDIDIDIDDDEMPPSRPGLRGEGRPGASVGGRPQFNCYPSATKGPLLPVLTVVLPIRVGAGRPVEALQRRGQYYSLALHGSSRWFLMHRTHQTAGRLELHLFTEAWPLCLMPSRPGQGLCQNGNATRSSVSWCVRDACPYPAISAPMRILHSRTPRDGTATWMWRC